MKQYQITFVWPNDDWTWIDVETIDFHQAMLVALDRLPDGCRVHHISPMTAEQVKANADYMARRLGGTAPASHLTEALRAFTRTFAPGTLNRDHPAVEALE